MIPRVQRTPTIRRPLNARRVSARRVTSSRAVLTRPRGPPALRAIVAIAGRGVCDPHTMVSTRYGVYLNLRRLAYLDASVRARCSSSLSWRTQPRSGISRGRSLRPFAHYHQQLAHGAGEVQGMRGWPHGKLRSRSPPGRMNAPSSFTRCAATPVLLHQSGDTTCLRCQQPTRRCLPVFRPHRRDGH